MSRWKSKKRKSCFCINLQMRLEDDIWIGFWQKKTFWTLIVIERDRFIVILQDLTGGIGCLKMVQQETSNLLLDAVNSGMIIILFERIRGLKNSTKCRVPEELRHEWEK